MTELRVFEPLSDYFLHHPFAELKRMREHSPVYRHTDTLIPVTSLFRAADIRPMLNDWRQWSSQRTPEFNKKSLGAAAILLGDDPPFHSQIKSVVLPFFTPGAVRAYETNIGTHVDNVLDKCVGAGEINFIHDVAELVSAATICSVAGIPLSDRDLMLDWSHRLKRLDGRPVFWQSPQPEAEEEVKRVLDEAFDYFAPLRGKTYFDNGLFQKLAESIEDDTHLIGLCVLLVLAGIGTTSNQMTHLLQELVKNPEQMASLRRNTDSLLDSAIEESLRLRGTARKVQRFAMNDAEIGGVHIAKGESVVMWLASANRDSEVFDRPDEFDISRRSSRHVTFGTGIHLCLGNALARMEIRVLMKRLLDRARDIVETRGSDSYEPSGNAMSEGAARYSVELL